MIGTELGRRTGEELVRLVRTLGKHRYVASRLHLVHAFAIEAACAGGDAGADLADARAWARDVLTDPSIDRGSRDERLHRKATDVELVAVLAAHWSSERKDAARARLVELLRAEGADPEEGGRAPFDESREDDVFPVLVDAGWELLTLAALDPERHKGAMQSFEDQLAWEIAVFEEQNAVPKVTPLHELPALGPVELLDAFDDEGRTRAPFVLWASGNETYLDYVLRGVLRASKLEGAADAD
jgi:hypothetical protein